MTNAYYNTFTGQWEAASSGSGGGGSSQPTIQPAAQPHSAYVPWDQLLMQSAPVPAPWQEKPGSHYWPSHTDYQHYFTTTRKQKKLVNATNGVNPPWSEVHEMQLVNSLHQSWFGEEWAPEVWNYEYLNLDKLDPVPLRKRELKPFKIAYQTLTEIKLRLNNTVISVKGHPYVVSRIKQKDNGEFILLLHNGSDDLAQVHYSDLQDLRSIPSMYVNAKYTGWLARVPGRIYQQGLTRQNSFIQTPDGSSNYTGIDPILLCQGIRKREDSHWNKTLERLIANGELTTTRLSDDVAVTGKKGQIIACYRGRSLGEVKDGCVEVFDEDDLLQQWISNAAQKVGLELHA